MFHTSFRRCKNDMKFILLSDLHLTCNTPIARLDNVEETWKRKLKFILDYAKLNEMKILVAGDFFDRPRDWRIVTEFLKLMEDYEGVTISSVFGQHDMYLYSKDRYSTSLGVLIKANVISELDDTKFTEYSEVTGPIYIYGCSWGQEIPKPEKGSINILVIHKNISDAPLFPGHEYTGAELFLKSHPEYHVIICGDIHKRFFFQKNGRIIVNPGPLLRMEATEYNMAYDPAFPVLDIVNQSVEWVTIPHESSGAVLSRKHIENKKETESMLDEFIKNVSVDHKITFSFKENLQEYLTNNNIPQDVKNIISKVMED